MFRTKPPPHLPRHLLGPRRLHPQPFRPFDVSQQHNRFSDEAALRPSSTTIYKFTPTEQQQQNARAEPASSTGPPSMQPPPIPMTTRLNVLAESFTPTSKTPTPEKILQLLPKKDSKLNQEDTASAAAEAPTGENARNHGARPREPPSEASGGIPSPSALYLTQALSAPTTLTLPRRILVILDLNGTLLYRPSRRHPSRFVKRPHAHSFLNYCLQAYHLAIWSSARPQNVTSMVSQLLTPEQRAQCVVIWARDKLGLCKDDYSARVQVYKRLSELWNDPHVRASHPEAAEGARWDQSNTVLVDDSLEKGRSEPFNILAIPEFVGLHAEPANVLPQVHDYLNLLCFQADVSRFMRESPFNLDPAYRLPDEP